MRRGSGGAVTLGGVQLLNGAAVDPESAGCCVGLTGIGESYATCMSEPTTSGIILIPDAAEYAWVFTCDRHVVVVESPRPLTFDDVNEMRRRAALGG